MSQESQLTAPTSPKHQIGAELGEGLNSSSLELPVMPRVASKVLALTHDPNAEVSDLSELIHSDQSIASHVLRIANSAAYGGGDQIVSLQQAVARLGMNLLGEIAIAVSVQNVMNFPTLGEAYRIAALNIVAKHASTLDRQPESRVKNLIEQAELN